MDANDWRDPRRLGRKPASIIVHVDPCGHSGDDLHGGGPPSRCFHTLGLTIRVELGPARPVKIERASAGRPRSCGAAAGGPGLTGHAAVRPTRSTVARRVRFLLRAQREQIIRPEMLPRPRSLAQRTRGNAPKSAALSTELRAHGLRSKRAPNSFRHSKHSAQRAE